MPTARLPLPTLPRDRLRVIELQQAGSGRFSIPQGCHLVNCQLGQRINFEIVVRSTTAHRNALRVEQAGGVQRHS
jgi:hypothetical protein